MRPGEAVYDVIVDESDDRVEVLVLVCRDGEPGNESIDCPLHIWLDSPQGPSRERSRSRSTPTQNHRSSSASPLSSPAAGAGGLDEATTRRAATRGTARDYSGDAAKIEIATGAVIAGSLPGRALRLVREWVEEHRDELEANWERAVRYEETKPIQPLR